MFNPNTYFEIIANSLKDLSEYYFTTVSGLAHLEGVLNNAKKTTRFFALDDSDDGHIMKGGGYGFYERRFYTCYILKRVDYTNMSERNAARDEARTIFRKILSKMITDEVRQQNKLDFLDTSRIRFFEFPGIIGPGCGGIYFTFSVDNPVNLQYDESDWS